VDGKRRRKSVYGRTQREAQAKLKAANREKDTGTLVVASMTVAKWLDYWLDNIAARELRPQTQRAYRSKVDTYLKPLHGRHRLTALRPEHVRELHDTLRARGLSESTVRQAHAILKKSLRVAMYEGKVSANVADLVKAPKTETDKRQALTVDQARAVLRAAGDDPRWWLAVFYGMRQGEVLGLRRGDVDLAGGVLHVRQSLQTDTSGQLIFGPPKSKASRRPLPLLPQVEVRLRLALADLPDDPEALIFSNQGRPIQPKRDWLNWRALLDAAATPPLAPIPYVPLHAARNSAASLMEAGGVPERLAMQILGHSQVTMTRSYTTAELDRLRTALDGVGNLLALE
jgi:integrase